MKTSATLIMTLGLAPLFALSASATEPLPLSCEDSDLVAGAQGNGLTRLNYLSAASGTASLVRNSWSAIERCEGLDSFTATVESIMDGFELTADASAASVCRFTGAFDGIASELELIAQECGQSCSAGHTRGALAARVYCEISVALGGIDVNTAFVRSQARLCDWDYEVGCESAFDSASRAYAGGAACAPFLTGRYREVWARNQSKQCSFYKQLQWTWDGQRL